MSPLNPWATAKLGTALFQAGEEEAGIRVLRETLERHPELPLAWMWLGHAYMAAGEPAKAYEAYRQSVRQLPEVQSTQQNVVNLLLLRQFVEVAMARGEYREARDSLKRIRELVPDDPQVQRQLYEIHLHLSGG